MLDWLLTWVKVNVADAKLIFSLRGSNMRLRNSTKGMVRFHK